MSFSLIKAAQAATRMGNQELELAHHVSQVLNRNVLGESLEQNPYEVTPEHYVQWLETIQSIGAERGAKLSKRMEFNAIAFDVLDNDSFVDSIASDEQNLEQTKENIVKALWQSYKVNQAAARVKQGVDSTVQQVQDEESAVRSMVGLEDEESGFGQLLKTAAGVEDEEVMFKKSSRPGTVYQQAVAAKISKNPYPKGSLRHSIWIDMNGSEEEELHQPPVEDHHADVGGEEALEQQVADLAQRVSDLEAHEANEHEMGDDEYVDDADVDTVPDLDAIPRELDQVDDAPSLTFTSKQRQTEDEEQVADVFKRAITSPRNMMTDALKQVEAEGLAAWKGISMPRNPHPKDSPAHKAWAKGMKNAAVETFGLAPKVPTAPTKSKKK